MRHSLLHCNFNSQMWELLIEWMGSCVKINIAVSRSGSILLCFWLWYQVITKYSAMYIGSNLKFWADLLLNIPELGCLTCRCFACLVLAVLWPCIYMYPVHPNFCCVITCISIKEMSTSLYFVNISLCCPHWHDYTPKGSALDTNDAGI